MANFKIAEQFVDHLRLHRGRSRIAVNQGQLAKSFDCSVGALQKWIGLLMEAKIINRSSDRGLDGFEYWLSDDTLLVPEWRDFLHLALKMGVAKSPRFNVRQKFGVLNELLRDMRSGVEGELSALKQTLNCRDFRIKELEEENSSMRFEMNRMMVRMQELEMAHNSLVATANSREQKMAAANVAVAESGFLRGHCRRRSANGG